MSLNAIIGGKSRNTDKLNGQLGSEQGLSAIVEAESAEVVMTLAAELGTGRSLNVNMGNKNSGLSAYEIWLQQGNIGSEQDFLNSLKGEAANEGAPGKSAYEIWLKQGNTGSEADFIASLKGEKGADGQQGEKGDTGPAGPQGEKGDSGPQGPQGPKGDTGPAGPQGTTGDAGPQGEKGDKGDTGPQGPRGAQGVDGKSVTHEWAGTILMVTSASGTSSADLKGAKGDTGPQGLTGEKGETGVQGPQGPQGEKGDTGPAGPQGPQGPKGDKGDTGPQGEKGDKGDTGATGPQGPKGDTGPQGPQGMQGDRGEKGQEGAKGADGKSCTHSWNGTVLTVTSASGTTAADLKGPKGDTGPTGPQGEQGEKGATGSQGLQGAKGNDGTPCTHHWSGTVLTVSSASGTSSADLKGAKGDTGRTGPQGPKGDTGAMGIQGPKGDKGDTGPGWSIPQLTSAQRSAMMTVLNSYYDNRTSFVYSGASSRNTYAVDFNTAAGRSAYDSNGKIKLNCSLFAQMVWAGIPADTFVGKQSSYTGTGITKGYDWGYYFKFPWRKFSGVKQSSGALYGLVKPNAASDIATYSANTYYSVNGTEANSQFFYTYMTASDMARELKFLGCEIPLNEVMPGDLVFFKTSRLRDKRLDDVVDNTIEDGLFMNIDHVAVVTDTTNLSECDIQYCDCSTYWGSNTISKCSVNDLTISTRRGNGAHAADLSNRIVMVARHPQAFGITNRVPSTISAI